MSEARKAISEGLSGKDEINWSQFGDVSDLVPGAGVVSKRGRKPGKESEVRVRGNSEFEKSEVDELIMDEVGLHGASLPEHRIQHEKTDHTFLVFLFAQGKSVKDVFLTMGGKWDDVNGRALPVKEHGGKYSYAHLTQIRRQPWFQKKVVQVMTEQGVDVVAASFAVEFQGSLETLVEVRDDVEEKGSTRVAAANSILDRILGKATQHVKQEVTTKSIGEIASDKKQLDKELEVLEAEITAMAPDPVRDLEG